MMGCYIQVFYGGIPVSISAVKDEKSFFHTVSHAIYKELSGFHYITKIYSEGIVIEGDTIPERFLGTIIPVIYHNRNLELRVFPKVFTQ